MNNLIYSNCPQFFSPFQKNLEHLWFFSFLDNSFIWGGVKKFKIISDRYSRHFSQFKQLSFFSFLANKILDGGQKIQKLFPTNSFAISARVIVTKNIKIFMAFAVLRDGPKVFYVFLEYLYCNAFIFISIVLEGGGYREIWIKSPRPNMNWLLLHNHLTMHWSSLPTL